MTASGIDEWASMDDLSVMGLFEGPATPARDCCGCVQAFCNDGGHPTGGIHRCRCPLISTSVSSAGCALPAFLRCTMSSPTVWAWRTRRVRKIRRAVDLLLTIFPFETGFLDRYQVPSHYVGHPWPATCRCSPDRRMARQALGIDPTLRRWQCCRENRRGEVGRLARPFIETVAALREQVPDLQVVVPLVNETTRAGFEQVLRDIARRTAGARRTQCQSGPHWPRPTWC